MAATGMEREQFVDWLRAELPRLLQEDPRFSAELVGILAQSLGTRTEFNRILDEIRDLREDFARRFEAADQRFQAMDRRFEELREDMNQRFQAMDRRFEELREDMNRRFQAMDRRFEELRDDTNRRFEAIERTLASHGQALRRLDMGMGSLGNRSGKGLEETVRATIEEFAGVGPLRAERLVLRDTEGEVFAAPGQDIEFDAFVHDGRRFLAEVKSFARPQDVLVFHRKIAFAKRHLDQPFEPLLIAPYARKDAVRLARELGIRVLMDAAEDLPEDL